MTRFTGAFTGACLVLSVSLPPAWAQTPPTSESTPAPVLPPTQESPDAVPLSLADALRTALENNLDIRVQKVNPAIAEQQIQLAWSPFDPQVGADYLHSHDKREPFGFDAVRDEDGNIVNVLTRPSSISKSDTVSAFWADRLTFGGDYRIELFSDRTNAPSLARDPRTGALISNIVNPLYTSGFNLSFTIPLFKNLGTEVNKLDILIAESNLAVSQQELADRVNRTLQAVEDAYWNVAATAKAREVALQSRGLAQELLELNRRKVEVGTLAPIEITQAEAGVAEREENVIVAETARRDAEDQLRALMALPRDDPRWTKPIAAVEPVEFQREDVDVQQRIDRALSTRPELEAARRSLEARQLSERVAKNQTRPEINIVGGANPGPYGNNYEFTVAPAPLVPPDPFQPDTETPNDFGGRGQSLSEIPDFDNYNVTLGAQFRYSIHNRAAKANLAIAGLDREQAELNIANLEQSISVEVRTAARGVVSGQERIAAARKNVELQERKLDAEKKKFENGMSTSFEVLTFQNDLAAAQLSLIQAAIDYQRARVELERSTGTLVEARGMRFDPTAGR
jgi:outer membrane protein TolC